MSDIYPVPERVSADSPNPITDLDRCVALLLLDQALGKSADGLRIARG